MTVITFVRELSLNLHLFICSHKWFRNMVMLHTLFSGDVSGAQAVKHPIVHKCTKPIGALDQQTNGRRKFIKLPLLCSPPSPL
jgi:hypothetical protein